MSAREYCGEDFHDASTFSELCLAAQFRILFQIFFIPITTVGNILIIATIVLLKKRLCTPHDLVIFALAIVDLVMGNVVGPLHLVESFPDNPFLTLALEWECAMFYSIYFSMDTVAFDLLTLMCVDRWIMVWKPVWHKTHISRRKMIMAIVGILVFRAAYMTIMATFAIFNCHGYHMNFGCVGYHYSTPLNEIMLSVVLVTETFSLALCIATVRKAFRQHRVRAGSLTSNTITRGNKIIKFNAIFISSLVFVFLILWLPGTLTDIVYAIDTPMNKGGEGLIPPFVFDLARLIRWTNSGINAPLYAMTRKIYRISFKFLLTTPPWRWKTLQKSLKIHEDRKHEQGSEMSSLFDEQRTLETLNLSCTSLPGIGDEKRMAMKALNCHYFDEIYEMRSSTSKVHFDFPTPETRTPGDSRRQSYATSVDAPSWASETSSTPKSTTPKSSKSTTTATTKSSTPVSGGL